MSCTYCQLPEGDKTRLELPNWLCHRCGNYFPAVFDPAYHNGRTGPAVHEFMTDECHIACPHCGNAIVSIGMPCGNAGWTQEQYNDYLAQQNDLMQNHVVELPAVEMPAHEFATIAD